MLAAKKVHEKTKDKDVKWGKHLIQPCVKNIEILARITIIYTRVGTSSFHSYDTYYHKLKLLTSIE